MQVGIIGGGNLASLSLGMALAQAIAVGMPKQELYKMSFSGEDQYFSKIYKVNNKETRGDFVALVAEKEFDYLDSEAMDFVDGKYMFSSFKVERV